MNRRERRRAAKKQNRPEVQLEERGRDLFFNGLHIARRGDPGTLEAKWVPLVSGFRIADDGHEITIETPDLRYYFGHLVIAADQTDEPDRYADTNEPVEVPSTRACPKCGQLQNTDGCDPCIGFLPGVRSACCGHGVQRGFIAFKNGVVVRGMFDEIEHLNAAELARLFVVTAATESPDEGLKAVVSKEDYRQTFLKMTRNLSPTGKVFTQMDIQGAGDRKPVSLSPESRKLISDTLRGPSTAPASTDEEEVALKGVLRALDLDNDWLELSINDEHQRVIGVGETVDDVIGPMVNHDVIVRARRGKRKSLTFIDIEQEE